VRGAPKILAALAALLLALGLAACGGGGSGAATSSPEAAGGAGKSGSGHSEMKGGESKGGKAEGSGSEGAARREEAAKHASKPDDDSGGGSAQFKVKGGDRSVRELGAAASASDFKQAATTLHNYLDARAAGNRAAACRYMAKTIIGALESLAGLTKHADGSNCVEVLEKLTTSAPKSTIEEEAAQADARSLRVEGDRGFLIYRGAEGAALAMRMAREGGRWKVAAPAGTALD
jgi:hypothetical protein